MTGLRWVCWTVTCMIGLCFVGTRVDAADYTVIPSLKLRETYDDNVFFKDVSDFEHLISPGLAVKAKRDTAELELRGRCDISEYADHSELNTVEQAYGLSASALLNPLLEISLSGDYVNDYTFHSALEESGLVAERSKRKSVTLGPRVSVVVAPRYTLLFDYVFEKTEYSFEDYADYWMHGLTVTLGHDLLEEQTSIFFGGGAHMVDFDRWVGQLRQYSYRAFAGLRHGFTENLHLSLRGGARHTKSESEEPGGTFTDRDWGFIFDGALEWQSERTTVSGYVRRDIAPSIYDEIITRDRVGTVFQYRFTERFRGDVTAEYYRSETEGVSEKRKVQTFWVRPALQYRITDHVRLRSGYWFTTSENRVTDETENRNRVFLQLKADWPQHL